MRVWRRFVRKFFAPGRTLSTRQYWERRVLEYGRFSVLNLEHSTEDFEAVTEQQKRELYPCLQEALRGDEKIILDFGCGPGRFTADLASLIGGTAVGVDPISSLIDLAPPAKDVEYRVMLDQRIPLSTQAVDVVWVCLVLGGLKEDDLRTAIAEIDRVLKPGGLLFLVENTSDRKGPPHWSYRSFENYREMLPFVSLSHRKDYLDLSDRNSIMVGRKPPEVLTPPAIREV